MRGVRIALFQLAAFLALILAVFGAATGMHPVTVGAAMTVSIVCFKISGRLIYAWVRPEDCRPEELPVDPHGRKRRHHRLFRAP